MIKRKIELPTGNLFVGEYSKGELEALSIGDYGRHHNVKANFLGYDRPINGVPNVKPMPLSEKWVVTVSTQYGCSMKCRFCDVPKVKFRGNATFDDLHEQVCDAIALNPHVKYTERLNIHFARMGEPILNPEVIKFAQYLVDSKDEFQRSTGLRAEVIHPVLSTMIPRQSNHVQSRLLEWAYMKNIDYKGQAGLQISVNSTNEEQRTRMFNDMQTHLDMIAKMCKALPEPVSRKYCLNFALSTGAEVDARRLRSLFSPDKFMCKITPIHNNDACRENGFATSGGYESFAPYADVEEQLLNEGFDVIVFVPSMDEEDGLVTCGNAVLSGSEVRVNCDHQK